MNIGRAIVKLFGAVVDEYRAIVKSFRAIVKLFRLFVKSFGAVVKLPGAKVSCYFTIGYYVITNEFNEFINKQKEGIMGKNFYHFSQGDLIAFSKGMLEGNKHFTAESWAFPDALRVPLETESANYDGLFIAQNLSEGEKEVLMKRKNDHFKDVLDPTIRRVVHFVKATAEDSENVLNGYGYDPGDFPRSQGDIVALGENMVKGDDESQGEPWALTPERKQELVNAVNTGQSLMLQCQIAFGEQQETTQTQDECRERLEDILARCREWLYANVPQARHDEVLEFYGLKPIKETPRKKKPHPEPLPAPTGFTFDEVKQLFVWDFMEAALLYELEISRDNGQTWVQKYKDVDRYFEAGHLDTGKALARVRALDGYQDPGKWTAPLEVKFTLLAPSFVAYSQYKNEFVWDWVPLATRYELEISPDGAQWSQLYSGPNNHVVKPLEKGDWQVRARAVRDESPEVFSDWSKVVPVNIIFVHPAGLIYKSSAKKIEWDKVTGAAQYQLVNESVSVNYIGADNHFDIELMTQEKFRVRAGDGTMQVWGEWSDWTILG